MKTSILIIVTLLLFAVASQSNGQNSYNDVAVIINTNSTLSDSIGKYFIGARNIPASNVIYISAPVTEEIDSLQFENLRNQIDQDGMFEYSPEVSVTVGASGIARNEMRNYPNPFNPATQISVSLESDDDVTLKVYDITGREVATLMHGIVSAGTHTVAFNAAQLPSGTYFAQLQTSTSVINKKMLLVK